MSVEARAAEALLTASLLVFRHLDDDEPVRMREYVDELRRACGVDDYDPRIIGLFPEETTVGDLRARIRVALELIAARTPA